MDDAGLMRLLGGLLTGLLLSLRSLFAREPLLLGGPLLGARKQRHRENGQRKDEQDRSTDISQPDERVMLVHPSMVAVHELMPRRS